VWVSRRRARSTLERELKKKALVGGKEAEKKGETGNRLQLKLQGSPCRKKYHQGVLRHFLPVKRRPKLRKGEKRLPASLVISVGERMTRTGRSDPARKDLRIKREGRESSRAQGQTTTKT